MNYGMWISSSSVAVNMARQDVYSNNLANVQTAAFKPDMIAVRQRDAARIEDSLGFVDSNKLIERLGAGVMPTATMVDTTPAATRSTGNPLDVAIKGDGFFAVRAHGGVRLTRDGRLTLGSNGQLVLAGTGSAVLDTAGVPVTLDSSAPIEIASDGRISQRGAVVAQLRVVEIREPGSLVKEGNNLLRADDEAMRTAIPASGRIIQGSLEDSGVNAVKAIMQVTSASRAAQGGLRMVSVFGEIMERTINTLGRVA